MTRAMIALMIALLTVPLIATKVYAGDAGDDGTTQSDSSDTGDDEGSSDDGSSDDGGSDDSSGDEEQ